MNKFNVKAWALTLLFAMVSVSGFAQESDDSMEEDVPVSAPIESEVEAGEEVPAPAVEEESYDFSEEEY